MNLYQLALRERWSTLVARSKDYPDELSYQDDDGLTVLHLACINQLPASTIRLLLENDNGGADSIPAALKGDKDGLTPLHCAASCQVSLEGIQELIRRFPRAAAVRDEGGWTPLHCLCSSYGSSPIDDDAPDVARILIDADSAAVTLRDNDGNTPLMLLWDSYEKPIFPRQNVARAAQHESMDDASLSGGIPKELRKFWALASVLIRNSCRSASGRMEMPILHSVAAMQDCPDLIMRLAIRCYAGQARERDGNGKLPLQYAIESRKQWHNCIRPILDLYPIALEACCISHNLYPSILERICSTSGIRTLYQIMRSKPDVALERGAASDIA